MIKHIAKHSPTIIIGILVMLVVSQWFTIGNWRTWVAFLALGFLWAIYITWRDRLLANDAIMRTIEAISRLSEENK